jgi:hypothetical protein
MSPTCEVKVVRAAIAHAGEIETQHGNASSAQGTGDIDGCREVFGAGEAMSENGVGQRMAFHRKVEQGRQFDAVVVSKRDFFMFHILISLGSFNRDRNRYRNRISAFSVGPDQFVRVFGF